MRSGPACLKKIDKLSEAAENPDSREKVWEPQYTDQQTVWLALLPLIWGTLLSLGLGAIPWGVFYLVRWIVQGFKV